MDPVPNIAFTVAQKDTLRIPHGDFPHGSRRIQRFDAESSRRLASTFASAKTANADFAIPLYEGHPDVPALAADYPDKKAYAWVQNVVADQSGLALQVKWSDAGEKLLANGHYRFISPYWNVEPIPSPKPNASFDWVRPVELVSVGLTNMPNIRAIPALSNDSNNNGKDSAMKEHLLKILGLANDATDDQIAAAVKDLSVPALRTQISTLQSEVAAGKTALSNEQTARATDKAAAQTAFAAERGARIGILLDNAVRDGRVTPATRQQWNDDLVKDFDGKVTALANAPKVIATGNPITQDAGKRKTETASRQDRVLSLVNAEISKNGGDYDAAWNTVKLANPDLFAQMHQPEVKKDK